MNFLTNTASASDMQSHLEACDAIFLKNLSRNLDIKIYTGKLKNLAFCFEAWESNQLIGLLAIYCNEPEYAFITNLSVLPEWQGKKLAFQLMGSCLEYLKSKRTKQLQLKVDKQNSKAIFFYKKFDFNIESEDRYEFTMQLQIV